ncbi:MAG: hypothetical protein KME15_02705 [Drouetiella hepatica Uher 2000/2452]|jgi:hypothetical protein|uniref:SPOR domain-containing protein n=1 Tax=Drouetiella hepatica Uher 2000/2452 TaxID=904376 RepID=A0A951UKT9_9CYAN|nr:hypothetical protein [Drouetiella hepatica Uher 2000/2452]
MTYRDRLNHWAVIRLLPKMQRVVVARFKNRSDADGYVMTLRRLFPDGVFVVVFDPIGE